MVTLDESGQRIEVIVQGDLGGELLRTLTEEVIAAVATHGLLAVLIDLSLVDGTPPPSAIQRLPEYYAARDMDRRVRFAVLLPPRGDRLDLSRFYKLSAQRHSYRVNIFESRAAAVEWLQEVSALEE